MHQEVRLHGHVNDTIEYFATAAGRNAYQCHFYENVGENLRFFSPGNEFILRSEGISCRGNGGSFCEYMFGVDQPVADLEKGNIRNRLVLYGARSQANGSLFFSDSTEGALNYERIFFEGNAIYNYFFFLTGSAAGTLKEQQQYILRLLGKLLKRSANVGESDDSSLAEEMFELLGPSSVLYLFKLINKRHKAYRDTFRDLYFRYKSIPDDEFERLQNIARDFDIDEYQQQRIRVDVMYKHPDNQRIVDEYRKILTECNRKGHISKQENACLVRLKTLSVRNKIPPALFYTLDELLKRDKLVEQQEQNYLAESRQILAGILVPAGQNGLGIGREDMIKLLFAKRQASENRDHTFEQLLLETGKLYDEKIRDGADISLLENFSYIITFFDRYDNAAAEINKFAFMEKIPFTEELIRDLLASRKAFDELEGGLFNQLLFEGVLKNRYLGQFGHKKILGLQKGLDEVEGKLLTVEGLLERLNGIVEQETLYSLLLVHVKDHIRNFYSKYNTPEEQETLRLETSAELHNKGLWDGEIPKVLFRDVVVNIKKEAVYLHNILPRVVNTQNLALREDFLENSGLDRFYVEELEREYFEFNNLNMEELNQIRRGPGA